MVPIAIAMFVTLVAFGKEYFGWSDPHDKIQLALIVTFVLGIVCGYRVKD